MAASTSMKPSTDPVTSMFPSGENAAASGWLFFPNFIVRSSSVGYRSSCGWAPGEDERGIGAERTGRARQGVGGRALCSRGRGG